MSVLFPAMLAGLLGCAVPIALHLIARHKFPIQEFPTIRLLQKDLRTNVFAPKLVDKLQLMLRLLVLMLLVFAMSRLFSPSLSTNAAPRNVVLVVDCSAGMRMQILDEKTKQKTTLLDRARAEGRQILEKLSAPGQCAVVLAAEQPQVLAALQSETAPALAALEKIDTIDGPGCGVVRAVAAACDLVSGRREIASQIVVLTDMRANAFASREQKDLARIENVRRTLGQSLQVFLVDLSAGSELENVGIVEASIRGRGAKVGDDAHVVARVLNSSAVAKTARLGLEIGDRKEPQTKEIPLEPGAEAVVDLTARVQRAANTVASVRVAEDAYTADDVFNVPLNISDTRRILIINGSSQATPDTKSPVAGKLGDATPPPGAEAEPTIDGATILRFVLNPGRELGAAHGTGIDVTLISPDAVATQTLSKYDLIALYDVSSLSDGAMEDLTTFVSEGRAALVMCAGNCQALSFNRTLAAGSAKRPALSPALIGNDKTLEQPLEIQQAGNAHALMTPFQDKLRGDLSVIRFTKIREIQSMGENASVLLNAVSGQPLALEHAVGRGRVVLLTFGFELDRGNIARARAFPPLMWRLVDYLTGQLRQRPPDVVKAMAPAVLDVSEPAFTFATELDLLANTKANDLKAPAAATPPARLACNADRTTLMPAMPAGRYVLTKSGQAGETARMGYSRYVTTYIDPIESDTRKQNAAELPALFGAETKVITAKDVWNLALPGGELWKILVGLLAIAYAGEALFGCVQSMRRERLRAGEKPV
jgi:hypothetical protein